MEDLEALKTIWDLFGEPGVIVFGVIYVVKAMKPVYDRHVTQMAAQNRVNAGLLAVMKANCQELNKHGYEIKIPKADILDP